MSEATYSDNTATEPGQPTPNHPDAAILALGEHLSAYRARCDDEDRRVAVLDEQDTPAAREEASRIMDASSEHTHVYHQILNGLRDTPAQTLDGMAVKAIAVADWMGAADDVPSSGEDGRVAWSLAHDVLRMRDGQISPTVSASPDADLIALCDDVVRIEQEVRDRFPSGGNPSDETIEAFCHPRWKERDRLVKRMGRLRATTPEGFAARARATVAVNQEHDNAYDAEGTVPHTLIMQLLADFPAVAPSHDAELIAACERFNAQELVFLKLAYGADRIRDEHARDKAMDAVEVGTANPALPDVLARRPVTLAGMRALARSALFEDLELRARVHDENASASEAILSSLALSLAGDLDVPAEIEAGRL